MLISNIKKSITCFLLWIGIALFNLCHANPGWMNTHFPPLFQYNQSDAWNAMAADTQSIVVQKNKSQEIWVFDGKNWKNTQLRSFTNGKNIVDWNMDSAQHNKIIAYTNDYRFFTYDGKYWHRLIKKMPVPTKDILQIFITSTPSYSVLLITRHHDMFVFHHHSWSRVPVKLLHPIGALYFQNPTSIIWTYAEHNKDVFIYDGKQIIHTPLSKLLKPDEDIAKSFLINATHILILTTQNNLWSYDGKHWSPIDSHLLHIKNKVFDMADTSQPNEILLLSGLNNDSSNHTEPSVLWQDIDIYHRNTWFNTKIPLHQNEYIHEINALANIHSIVAMTSLHRILVFDGKIWRDIQLPLMNNSITYGDWNAATANKNSIIVGIRSPTDQYFLMLYNGKNWRKIYCSICTPMDASYQKNINTLIVIDKNGQIFTYHDDVKSSTQHAVF